MRLALCSLFLFLVLGLIGCHKAPDLVGKWKLDTTKLPAGLNTSSAAGVSLEFKDDKTFTMSGVQPSEGTYTIADKTATMTLTKIAGKDVATIAKQMGQLGAALTKPFTATLSDDGKKLDLTGPMGGGQAISFLRS